MKALCAVILLACASVPATATEPGPLAPTEALFLEFLDAANAVDFIHSGMAADYEGRDLASWDAQRIDRHKALIASIAAIDERKLPREDIRALAAIRVTLGDYGDPSPAVANAPDSLGLQGPRQQGPRLRRPERRALQSAIARSAMS